MGRISCDVAISSAVIMYLYYSRFFPDAWENVPIKRRKGDREISDFSRNDLLNRLKFAVEIINSYDLTYCESTN